jgi:hypothetical protein
MNGRVASAKSVEIDPTRTWAGPKSAVQRSPGAPSVCYRRLAAQGGLQPRAPFRTIRPKDLTTLLRQVERAVDRRRQRGGNPDVRYEATRVHHAEIRHG